MKTGSCVDMDQKTILKTNQKASSLILMAQRLEENKRQIKLFVFTGAIRDWSKSIGGGGGPEKRGGGS